MFDSPMQIWLSFVHTGGTTYVGTLGLTRCSRHHYYVRSRFVICWHILPTVTRRLHQSETDKQTTAVDCATGKPRSTNAVDMFGPPHIRLKRHWLCL